MSNHEDNIVWYLTDGYWEDAGHARHAFRVQPGGTLTVNITALTQEGQQLARWALESWSLVTGIQFQEVSHGQAHIRFDDAEAGAETNYWYYLEDGSTAWAEINVGADWLADYGTGIASYSFTTYVHEIGHALGLGHPGDYNGSAIFAVDAKYELDAWSFTVMSYFDQHKNTNITLFDRAYPVSPMLADILAVADLYGVDDLTINDGDTVYGYRSNTGTYLDDVFLELVGSEYPGSYFRDVPDITLTIFDSGGTDWLDFRTDNGNQDILLGFAGEDEAALLNIYGTVGSVLVLGLIEHVIAGNGSDYITGNSYGNILDGMGGGDEIYGNGGNDVIYGNWGNDSIYGGDGNDRLIGSRGNDKMEGGPGYDVFVFGPDDGYGLDIYDVVVDFTADFDMIDLSRFDSINSRDDFTQYYLAGTNQENTYLDLTPHGGGYVVLNEVDQYLGSEHFIFEDDAMVA